MFCEDNNSGTGSQRFGQTTFPAARPDGTPQKLLEVSRMTALGWTARTEIRAAVVAGIGIQQHAMGSRFRYANAIATRHLPPPAPHAYLTRHARRMSNPDKPQRMSPTRL